MSLQFLLAFAFALTVFSVNISAKGVTGQYTLSGYALSRNGDTLKNQPLLMHLDEHIDTVLTDSKGYYSVQVRWSTECRSGTNPIQRRRATKKYNPKYIVFTYAESKVKVKNQWKLCMRSHFVERRCQMEQMNLVF